MQFAVGKTTHIPGLFFASPVMKDGKFMGAVVTKIDVTHLSYLTKTLDAFLVDNKGVILLSHDENLMLNALPSGSVFSMSEKDKFDRYRTHNIPKLEIRAWHDHPNLKLFQHEEIPNVVAQATIEKYGLTLFVESEVPSLNKSFANRFWIIISLVALGSFTIIILFNLATSYRRLRSAKESLWHQANFDHLTGLPNRNNLRTFLHQTISSTENHHLIALLIININKFKEINLRLGNKKGDQLLTSFATRLATVTPNSGLLVRREGRDEFYLVLTQLTQVEDAVNTAQKISQLLDVPFSLQTEHINSSATTELIKLSVTMGISFFPTDAKNIDELISNAEIAMHTAKSKGGKLQLYNLAIHNAEIESILMIEELHVALQSNQLQLYFQPIVNLATGHVYKAEALLRWNHPIKGFISPAIFIALAEKHNLSGEIGNFVRQQSIIWAKRWQQLTPHGFQISLNKSPLELHDEYNINSASNFIADLTKHNLHGKNFVFEITEGQYLDDSQIVQAKLAQLRAAGIQLAVDDFGTGYSSFSYLATLNADYLKIDQSLVKNIEHNPNDLVLCQTIILMGHKLGMKIIAEGIETKQQQELLSNAGCDYGQGYLYSKPVSGIEFEQWFIAHNALLKT